MGASDRHRPGVNDGGRAPVGLDPTRPGTIAPLEPEEVARSLYDLVACLSPLPAIAIAHSVAPALGLLDH